MQHPLRLPETLPGATLPPVHHTNAPPMPPLLPIPCNTPFAYPKRYLTLLCHLFTIPVHADATTPVHTMQHQLRTPFAYPKRYLAPLHHYFTILAHHRRHDPCQYHATHRSPTKNATWRYFSAFSPYQRTTDATTHANTMESPLQLLKTLPDATSLLLHHTYARRRCHSCQ